MSKNCIVVLINHNKPQQVNELIQNLNSYFVEKNKDVDLLLFHEYGFPFETITETYNGGNVIKHEINFDIYQFDESIRNEVPDIYYGFTIGYRMMCRFFSGELFKILKTYDYEYMMRLDTDSKFLEPVNRNLFDEFKNNNALYGYICVMNDRMEVRVNLLETVLTYIKNNDLKPILSIDDDIRHQYNLIFYNNFEMIKVSEFVSDRYLNYYEHLNSTNGFLKYRWGDAPVRFLYVISFIETNQIHYFSDLAYFHNFNLKNRPFLLEKLYLN